MQYCAWQWYTQFLCFCYANCNIQGL